MGHVEMREIWKLGQLAMAFSWWGDHWDKLTSPEFVSAVGEVGSAPFPQFSPGPPGRAGGRMSIWSLGIVKTEALPKSVPPRLGFIKEGPQIITAFIEEAQSMAVGTITPEQMVDRLAKRIGEVLK